MSVGGGRFICLKVLLFLNDGQNLLIIFMALAAEGVNLVMKANLLLFVLSLGFNAKDLFLNRMLLVC